jgi:hypothetical protein
MPWSVLQLKKIQLGKHGASTGRRRGGIETDRGSSAPARARRRPSRRGAAVLIVDGDLLRARGRVQRQRARRIGSEEVTELTAERASGAARGVVGHLKACAHLVGACVH